MLGKGAGRGFPGHPMLSAIDGDVLHALSRLPTGRGVPPNAGTAPTASRGGKGGTVWRKRTPFAPFQKGFFQRVEVGSAPPLDPERGQCASRDPDVTPVPPPGPGAPGSAFGWGQEDAASQGGAPPGVPLQAHAATFPVSASTDTNARVSQEWMMSRCLPS